MNLQTQQLERPGTRRPRTHTHTQASSRTSLTEEEGRREGGEGRREKEGKEAGFVGHPTNDFETLRLNTLLLLFLFLLFLAFHRDGVVIVDRGDDG